MSKHINYGQRGEAALAAYTRRLGGLHHSRNPEGAALDLLTDLLHYCDSVGVDIKQMVKDAQLNFEIEKKAEAEK